MENKLHIAILTDGITPYVTGGMQRHSYHLVKNLLNEGVRITLFHCVYDGQVLPDEEEVITTIGAKKGHLKVYGFQFPKGDRLPGHYIRASKKYAKLIATKVLPTIDDIDFIYTKGFTGWELLKLKRRGKKLPKISVKFHGYEMYQPTDDWKEKLKHFMLRPPVKWNNIHADYVFSYGGEISSIIQSLGVPTNKIIDICSGITDDWVRSEIEIKKDKRSFLFIGRNERRKGIQDLLQEAEIIKKLPLDFHWVGPIPQTLQIKSDNCIYHGEIKDAQQIKEILDQCDVLVTPSHAEGMPNVILEGMSRGLAVIATEVGAVPMMVSEDNGVLIPPFDQKALREAIQHMAVIDDEKLKEKQKNSLTLVREKFLWSSIATRYIEAIELILGKDA